MDERPTAVGRLCTLVEQTGSMRPMTDKRMSFRIHRKWFIVSLLCMALVLVLTHIPQEAMPRVFQKKLLDKIEHIGAYGLVAILFLFSLRDPVCLKHAAIGLLVLAGVGVLDETTQPLVNRIASVGDYISDLIGIALACMVFLVKKRTLIRR